MKYTDKNTINHAIKHDSKMAYDDSMYWHKLNTRLNKQKKKKFLLKISASKENSYWWKSLEESDKDSIVNYYTNTLLSELRKTYPGNIAIIRELKLKELKI
jgi:hypothetical protein